MRGALAADGKRAAPHVLPDVTHTYVNPVIAVLLGWLPAGELLTPRILGATGLILAAVVLLKFESSRRSAVNGQGICGDRPFSVNARGRGFAYHRPE